MSMIMSPRVRRFLRVTLVVDAIFLLALYIYVRYVSPTAGNVATSILPLLLLMNVIGALIYLNVLWFSRKLEKANPGLSRTLPRLFTLVTLSLMFFAVSQKYYFPTQVVIAYFVAWLLLFSVINALLRFRKRSGQS